MTLVRTLFPRGTLRGQTTFTPKLTRRKKLAICLVALLSLAAAGFVAVVALREPSMRSKFAQLREGITYDECAAILGEPTEHFRGKRVSRARWTGRDGEIQILFMPRRAEFMRYYEDDCKRIVPHPADTEDAFQATFLVLVQKAASVKPRDAVANWLYGVA